MSSIQGNSPQDVSKGQQTQETQQTSSPTTGNVPQTPDVVTLSALIAQVSSATESDQPSSDSNSGTPENVGDGQGESVLKDLSADQQVGSSQKSDDRGDRSHGNGGTTGGKLLEAHRDVTEAGRSSFSISPLDTSAQADANSAIEREADRESNRVNNAESDATKRTAPFSDMNTESLTKITTSFALEMPSYGASIGLSSDTIASATTHFQNAAMISQKLNNLSDDAPASLKNTLTQAAFLETRDGVKSMVNEMIANPETLTSAISQNFPKAISAEMAKGLIQYATTRNSSSDSSTSTPMNSSPSITAMSTAIANFISLVGSNQVEEAQFLTLENTNQGLISQDNASASNIINQNTISEVHKEENQEAEEEKKQKSSDKLMGALGIIGGVIGCIAGAVLIITSPLDGGLGAVAGVILIGCSATAVAQGASETQGKNLNTSAIIGDSMAKTFGGSAKAWTDAIEVTEVVAATAAGCAMGPMGAFMMLCMMSEQTGLLQQATQAGCQASGYSSETTDKIEMAVNITVAIAPIVLSGGAMAAGMMQSAASAAEDAAATAETAVAAANDASQLAAKASEVANASGDAEAIKSAASAVEEANKAQAAAAEAKNSAALANDAAKAAKAAKAAGDTDGAATLNTKARAAAAAANELSKTATSASKVSTQLSNQAMNQAAVATATSNTTQSATINATQTVLKSSTTTSSTSNDATNATNAASTTTTATTTSATTSAAKSGATVSATTAVDSTAAVSGVSATTTETTETLTQTTLKMLSNMAKFVSDGVSKMGSSISSALRGSSAATADDLYESMNNFMGVSKGAIANFAGYITTAGDIASGFGTAVNSLIEISLAKGLIDMANTQAEIDVNKASEQNIHIMMTTLNTFTGNSNQSGNGIINDLGQGTALDAQTAAANFSGIWEVQG